MISSEHGSLRAIVLPAPDIDAKEMPTRRMLGEMGHWVLPAADADDALRLANTEQVDLMVVDVSNSAANQALVRKVIDLPDDHRPRELAIFTDRFDPQLTALHHPTGAVRVHVFLKPLHVHGLLHLLRQIDADCLAAH